MGGIRETVSRATRRAERGAAATRERATATGRRTGRRAFQQATGVRLPARRRNQG